ncbi:hypothetical protein [Nocardia iowensis]|uniref:Uncharacterized protein n=1 Tax=Nocardia iowensis TaxID=204891 RepID=A0ABX8RYD2_NOCIO|nr:hypothetical protein [Nocardia iowensis]QXN94657.1 hypothetical protein KV110_17345 [Nocardia iowensis]
MTEKSEPQRADLDPDGDPDEAELPPDWPTMTYEVFNPGHTVGVACDRDGQVVGLHITDDARDNGDSWLAKEIVRIARLAHMKSRVGLRTEMEYKGVLPYTVDSFDLPTEAAYIAAENAEFGTTS